MARASRIEGGSCSNVALALAPRNLLLKHHKSLDDRGQVVFKMWLSTKRRAHSISNLQDIFILRADTSID
eukprot:688152-Pyramimonas_sp.AAC.1